VAVYLCVCVRDVPLSSPVWRSCMLRERLGKQPGRHPGVWSGVGGWTGWLVGCVVAAASSEGGRGNAGRPAVVLDVRNGYEWDAGHFEGAERPAEVRTD
jgi:hypothetical protein